MTRIIGIDPGLLHTGWGCVDAAAGVDVQGGRLKYVEHGVISVPSSLHVAQRLKQIYTELSEVINELKPSHIAIEEVFVNRNGESTMKLCMARGVVMLVPAIAGVDVFEYGANCIKKTVTGLGHADKSQVKTMVEYFLPALKVGDKNVRVRADGTDALAIAICHAQHLVMKTLCA
ncbi:MAG: crossover junction endodeoxyribonuclease RuvC [Holosporales bacterium]|jgi:crossover junction endodeoxyribonuclease RuvC|nr:crossover junction endodeoxyribonuclease RuvC [Holosporales bacterium]